MNLNSPGTIGNVMTRLGAGMKNVRPRRVMPGAEFLQELEGEDQDVSGTAQPLPNFANFQSPPPNQPESDLGGELTPQSYDVRANSVNPPPEEEGGFMGNLKKMGSYLGNLFKSEQTQQNTIPEPSGDYMHHNYKPPVATEQVDMQEGLPPVSAAQEEMAPQEGGIWEWIKSEAGKPYMGISPSGIAQGAANLFSKENFAPKIAPETYDQLGIKKPPEVEQQQQQRKQLDEQKQKEAEMNPMQVVAYGATDAFANEPELVEKFEEYSGLNFDERQKEMTEKYEKIVSDLQNGNTQNDAEYDEQSKRIKQRIMENQTNDADKFYVGLALLMPLLIGGIFGKEAGLGALGGGAQGIANVLKGRQENIRKDEELLSDIGKQRSINDAKKGELELEKLKIPEQVKKNLPKDEYEDIKGMKIVTLTDPKTGKVVATGPEMLPDLVLDLNYGNTPKKRERAEKQAEELEKEKSALERANQATSDIIKAAMQLKDAGIMSKILAYALSEEKNDSLKKLVKSMAPDIVIDGRKQNSAVYIDSKIEQMKDAYRRNEQMKAFTATVADHISNMAENPQYSGLKPTDLIDQMLIMRDRGQQFFVDRVASQGFYKEPLVNKFGKLNRELYKGLNAGEGKKQDEKDKQLMYGSP
jgi:hypothetical protein